MKFTPFRYMILLSLLIGQNALSAAAAGSFKSPATLAPDQFSPPLRETLAAYLAGDYAGALAKLESNRPCPRKAGADQSAARQAPLRNRRSQTAAPTDRTDAGQCQLWSSTHRYDFWRLQGLTQAALGEHAAAAAAFSQALKERGSDSDLLYLRGLSRTARGAGTAAVQDFEEALWFDRFQLADPSLAHFQAATILLAAGNQAAADKHITAASSVKTGDSAVTVQLAQLFLQQQRRSEALQLLRINLEEDPQNPALLQWWAQAKLQGLDRQSEKADRQAAYEAAAAAFSSTPAAERYRSPFLAHWVKALFLIEDYATLAQELDQVQAAGSEHPELTAWQAQLKLEQELQATAEVKEG